MKPKEVIQLSVALLVIAIAGILIYSFSQPKSAKKQITYEVVKPIEDSFDQDALTKLEDDTKARNFYVKPDLRSGIGNPQPFNPLK